MLGFGALAEDALAEIPGDQGPVPTPGIGAGSKIVAQTSATPIIPLTRRRYDEIIAAQARRQANWDELPTLIKLKIQAREFADEYNDLRDFSNLAWAQQRRSELSDLIKDADRKIGRWEEAEAFRKAHGLPSTVFKSTN